jgi:hypothetical protein
MHRPLALVGGQATAASIFLQDFVAERFSGKSANPRLSSVEDQLHAIRRGAARDPQDAVHRQPRELERSPDGGS